MYAEKLVKDYPGTEDIDRFSDWLTAIGKEAVNDSDREMLKLVDNAAFFIMSAYRRREYSVKIMARLKVSKNG